MFETGDGGFILSTGDQCGRDTPQANQFRMVEVAKTYGIYGNDLHTYEHARIGDTVCAAPLILGHEFFGTVE